MTAVLDRPYKRARVSIERAKAFPRDPRCAPWCDGTHRPRWNSQECVTCPAGFQFGSDADRLALFVKQDPDLPVRVEVWATDGSVRVVVPLDQAQLAALIGRLTAVAGQVSQ